MHTAPEADALSAELQGLERVRLPDRSMAPPAGIGGPDGISPAGRSLREPTLRPGSGPAP